MDAALPSWHTNTLLQLKSEGTRKNGVQIVQRSNQSSYPTLTKEYNKFILLFYHIYGRHAIQQILILLHSIDCLIVS